MIKKFFSMALSLVAGGIWFSACSKDNAMTTPPITPDAAVLNYGDSIFYLQSGASDYIVSPASNSIAGDYSGFPDGLEINAQTGAINVSKSETGLRYRVSFVAKGSKDTINKNIVISGVNYLDGFYRLKTADSILRPVYNANPGMAIPGVSNGSAFDEGSQCNSNGCNVNTGNGTINLAQTVRNGVFGATPANNDRHEFQLNYRINDKSGKALNVLKVKLYFFNSMNDVTQEAYDIINSRNGSILRSAAGNLPMRVGDAADAQRSAKPRPPCIFIVLN